MMAAVHEAPVEADRRFDTRDVSLSPRGDTSEIAKEEGYVLLRRRAAENKTAVRRLFHRTRATDRQRVACVRGLNSSTISGTIEDAQGGVMPGVTVTAVSTLNKQERSTVTDGSGFYTFANLQPGTNNITAELRATRRLRGRTSSSTRRAPSRWISHSKRAPSPRW